MEWIDNSIVLAINSLAQKSYFLDRLLVLMARSHLLNGGVLVALLVWAVEHVRRERPDCIEHFIVALFACFCALLTAKVMSVMLPARIAPINNPDLHFIVPGTLSARSYRDIAAFPSLHILMFMPICAALFYIHKKAAYAGMSYILLVIAFTKIYTGQTYFTDLVGSGILGALIFHGIGKPPLRRYVLRGVMILKERNNALLCALTFVILYQTADLYDSTVSIFLYFRDLLAKVF